MKRGGMGRLILNGPNQPLKVKSPAWIEIDGCDPEVAAIVSDVFNEMLSEDKEFLDRVNDINEQLWYQDYEDEHYNSPECNQ